MTVQILRDVRLYGELGRQFGRHHRLAIATPHEAVRALSATTPGFAQYLCAHNEPGFAVFVDKQPIALEDLHTPFGRQEVIKIVPVVAGAKSGALRLVMMGVLLYTGLGAVGGLNALSTAAGGAVASVGMSVGKALILGGIVKMLSPQRTGADLATTQNDPSYAFNGPVNTDQQGLPVPLVYGRVITGGAVISAGMLAEELASPAAAPAPAPTSAPLPPEQPLYVGY